MIDRSYEEKDALKKWKHKRYLQFQTSEISEIKMREEGLKNLALI